MLFTSRPTNRTLNARRAELKQHSFEVRITSLGALLLSGAIVWLGLPVYGHGARLVRQYKSQQPAVQTGSRGPEKNIGALEPGKKIERELRGGEAHSYSIALQRGQFMRVLVEQKGIDIVLTLADDKGTQLFEVDTPNGSFGPESLSFECASAGTFQVGVRSLASEGNGKYSIVAEVHPTASPDDRTRITAEEAFRAGLKQYQQKTKESVGSAIKNFEKAADAWHGLKDQYWESMALENSAISHSTLGDRRTALEQLSRALSLQQTIGDHYAESDTLVLIGTIHAAAKDQPKALEYLNQALSLKQTVGDQEGERTVLRKIAQVYDALAFDYYYRSMSPKERATFWTNEAKKALDQKKYNQAIESFRKAFESEPSAESVTNLVQAYQSIQQSEEGLQLLNEWKEKFGSSRIFRVTAAELNYSFAAELAKKGSLKEAIRHYQAAFDSDRFIAGRFPQITITTDSRAYSLLTAYDPATESFDQELAVEINQPAAALRYKKDKVLIYPRAAAPAANVARQREESAYERIPSSGVDAKELLQVLEKELAGPPAATDVAAHSKDLRNEGVAYAMLAGLLGDGIDYYQEGDAARDYDEVRREWQHKALDMYTEALQQAREQKNRRAEGGILNNLGILHTILRNYSQAETYYKQALAVAHDQQNHNGEARVLINLGANSVAQKQLPEALKYYAQALDLAIKDKDRKLEGVARQFIGAASSSLKRYDDSLRNFEAALAVARETRDQRAQAVLLNSIGRVLAAMNRTTEALARHQEALAISREIRNEPLIWTTLFYLGNVNDELQRAEEAIRYYQQASYFGTALPNFETAEPGQIRELLGVKSDWDRDVTARTRVNVGGIYYSLGQYQKAIDSYDVALRQSDRDSFAQLPVLLNMATVYLAEHKYKEAAEAYQNGVRIARAFKDSNGEKQALLGAGLANYLQQNYDDAIKSYEQARSLKHEDKRVLVSALLDLAASYEAVDRYAEAIDRLNQALALVTAASMAAEAGDILNDLGLVYTYLGQEEKAILLFQKALGYRRQTSDRDGEAFTLNNLAFCYSRTKETRKAFNLYRQALALERALGDRNAEGRTLGNLAELEGANRRFANALNLGQQALAIARQEKDRGAEGAALYKIGAIYLLESQFEKAVEYLHQALGIFHQVGDTGRQGLVLNDLMLAAKSSGNLALAILQGKEAVNSYQKVRADVRSLDREFQRSYIRSKEKTYRELADLLISVGRLPEAEQVLAMLKEEEYFDFVRRDSGEIKKLSQRADLTPEEQKAFDEYTRLANDITAIGSRQGALKAKLKALPEGAKLPADEQADYERLTAKLDTANKAFALFLERIKSEFSKVERNVLQDIKESRGLQRDLKAWGAGTVALYTIVEEDRYRVILTTPNTQVDGKTEIPAAELNKKVLAFREAVQNPRVDPRPLAQELYNILVKPIEKQLEGAQAKTLIWSLDGTLRYVPLAALYDGRQYMVEKYEQVIITLASRTRLSEPVKHDWLGLGLGVSEAKQVSAPDSNQLLNFSALPAVPGELLAVIRDEDASHGTLPRGDENGVLPGKRLLDRNFTARSFADALGRRYSLVHIASHFSFRPGNADKSFLLLGDGTLTLDAVRTKDEYDFTGVELLTLSACETGVGETGANGKEVEGFGALAQERGAKAVMATLWPVADDSTRELMVRFYRLYQNVKGNTGLSKAEALRQAQLELLTGKTTRLSDTKSKRAEIAGVSSQVPANQPRFTPDPKTPYAHPYYWAPFILIGNWR